MFTLAMVLPSEIWLHLIRLTHNLSSLQVGTCMLGCVDYLSAVYEECVCVCVCVCACTRVCVCTCMRSLNNSVQLLWSWAPNLEL